MMPATFLRHIPTNTLRMLWHVADGEVWTIDADGNDYHHSAEAYEAQYEPYEPRDWYAAEQRETVHEER